MAKKADITRKMQYTNILTGKGASLESCAILGYRFPDEMHAYAYHFDLMNNNVKYLVFDAFPDGRAVVAFRQGEPAIEQAVALALDRGGKEYKPTI